MLRPLALALALAAPALALPAPAGAFEAHGVVAVDTCVPGPAGAELVGTRAAGGPWVVALHVDVSTECVPAAACQADGTLGAGLALRDCAPGGSGTLGPVVVCRPGPYTGGPVVMGFGDLAFTSFEGWTATGRLTFALAGGAVDEAPNVCV